MDRQEFMQDLRESLEGEISPSAVQDNLRYYNNYFVNPCGCSNCDINWRKWIINKS